VQDGSTHLWYQASSGTAGNAISFTQSMTLNASGNLGLGTTNPQALLHLASVSPGIYIDDTSTSGTRTRFRITTGDIGTTQAALFQFDNTSGTNLITTMTVNELGNVGIGTTSPDYKLQVNSSQSLLKLLSTSAVFGSPSINLLQGAIDTVISATNNGLEIGTWSAHPIIFRVSSTGSTEAMRITSGGNVAIGTTTADSKLTISSSTKGLGVNESNVQIQSNESLAANIGGSLGFGATSDYGIVTLAKVGGYRENATGTSVSSYLAFETRSGGNAVTERMRITSGGFTKISNSGSYGNVSGNYHEIRSNAGTNAIIISNTNASPYIANFNMSGTPNNNSIHFLYCEDSTALRINLLSNGGIANYQANNTNLSDIRTKKDITPLESYWDKFKAIEMVKFKYKDQTHDDFNIGVIAQQVEKVAPEFIDVDGFGETPKDGVPLKSVYTADLHHATIKVLQEAMDKIEDLQNQLDTLKNK